MNEQNLVPVRSETEAREKGRAGGIASGEARRRKKTYREIAQSLRDVQVPVKMPDGGTEQKPLDEAVMLALYKRALKGEPLAVKTLLQIQGEFQDSLDVTTRVQGLNIEVADKETKDALAKVLNLKEETQEE